MGEKSESGYKLLRQLTLPLEDYVKLADKRALKPYILGRCRLPLKFLNKETGELLDDFRWDNKGRLQRVSDGLIVPSNSKSVGKPRYKKINGQSLYNSNLTSFARNNFIKALHAQLGVYLKEIEPIQDITNYPLGIYINFYTLDRGKHNIDNDNRWVWNKALQDSLVEHNIIPDDNPYIIWENITRTILVSDESMQKIILEIYGYGE